MFFLGSFGIALASLVIMDLTSQLTSVGESSPRAQSLIIIPKLAGSGWLAGWLAGNQTKTPSKRNISLSVAELKVHEKNIQKRRRQAGGYKS